MAVIGLMGKLRSGKDALADILVEHHGYTKMGMSDVLLDACLVLDPYVPINEYQSTNGITILGNCIRFSDLVRRVGYVQAKENPEVRRFMQVVGTDFGRNMLGEDIWVDAMKRRINEARQETPNIVVTGIRFPNENAMFSAWRDGYSARVSRPGLPDSKGAEHVSESHIDTMVADFEVDNSGTLEDLAQRATELLEEIANA